MPQNDIDRILSVTEAAEAAGVRTVTVQRWIRAGKLHATKLPGRTGAYVINANDLDLFFEQRAAEKAAS